MVLLTGAGLLVRSFVGVLHTDIGFQPGNILTVQFGLTDSSAPQTARFYRDLMQRIGALPGVRTVGAVSNLFFLDEKRTHALRQVEGRPPEPKSSWKPLVWTQISGDYFRLWAYHCWLAAILTTTTDSIRRSSQSSIKPSPGATGPMKIQLDAVSKVLTRAATMMIWLTVVGVVKDMRSGGLEKPAFSQIYEVFLQPPLENDGR